MDALKQSWEIDILSSLLRKTFYIPGLFQTITADVAVEKNIHR